MLVSIKILFFKPNTRGRGPDFCRTSLWMVPHVLLHQSLEYSSNAYLYVLIYSYLSSALTLVLVILLYVGWKKKHEILYVDHLKQRRMIPMDDQQQKFMPLTDTTTYFSPENRKIQRYESGFRNGGYQVCHLSFLLSLKILIHYTDLL